MYQAVFQIHDILTWIRIRGSMALTINGQCQTNPWWAVPDWPWYRNADAGLKKLTVVKNSDARLTFLRHLHMIFQHHTELHNNTSSSRLWMCRVYHFPLPQFCSVDVRGVLFSFGMSDFAASNQSGTGINKNADAGTSPVPECSDNGLR